MDITVTFPGGKRVDAKLGDHVVPTDQPGAGGGADSAPAPFELFLASLATCAGIYVLGFCQARQIPTDALGIVQHHTYDPATKQLTGVELELVLPPGFPERYRDAVVRAAESCKVKKLLAPPPTISVATRAAGAVSPSTMSPVAGNLSASLA